MKYAIVIDSVATLPEYVIQERPIKILPVTIMIDGVEQPDTIVASELEDIYSSGKINIDSEIDTIPPTQIDIRQFILNDIAPHFDYAVCQTTSAQNSPIFSAFEDCASTINKEAKTKRNSLGIHHPFYMSYINSETSNAGQGVVALYADALLSRGEEFHTYRDNVGKFKKAVRTYTVVKDVLYTRNRAKRLGIESIGLSKALIGQIMGVSPIIRFTRDVMAPVVLKPGFEKAIDKVCDYAVERIREGLYLPIINIAYAGNLADLHGFTGFKKLENIAKSKNIRIIVGMMSLCGCINYSPGSFSLGLAPKNQAVDPQ